jgi:hypothetical protein
MPCPLSDDVVLCLYRDLIVPWETQLKTRTGCWDAKRTNEVLFGTRIHLECVEVGKVERTAAILAKAEDSNFVVFVSSSSQMRDLFRHIRNCAAHARIIATHQRAAGFKLHFQGYQRGRPELAVQGQLAPKFLPTLLHSLVTESPLASK